jgi:hypothetical protein
MYCGLGTARTGTVKSVFGQSLHMRETFDRNRCLVATGQDSPKVER